MGLIPLWGAVVTSGQRRALALNYNGNSMVDTKLGARRVRLTQITQYPTRPEVNITVDPGQPGAFPLWLRIPEWSRSTRAWLNGRALQNPTAGCY